MAEKIKKSFPGLLILTLVLVLGFGFYFQQPKSDSDTSPAWLWFSTQEVRADVDTATTNVTVGNAIPTLSGLSLNGGATFAPNPAGVIAITVSGQITDDNGCSDITTITGAIFVTIDVNLNCSANDDNCYIIATGTCITSSCTAGVADVSCPANIQFWAEPTDDDSDEWVGAILFTDGSSATVEDTSVSESVEYTGSLCISVVPASLAYGSLAPGANTGATNQSTLVANVCNTAMDFSLSGTDMTEPSTYTIVVTEQQYGTVTFTYDGAGQTVLDVGAVNIFIDAAKPSASPTNSSDEIFWGIGIPSGAPNNTEYGGVNTFTAINDA